MLEVSTRTVFVELQRGQVLLVMLVKYLVWGYAKAGLHIQITINGYFFSSVSIAV